MSTEARCGCVFDRYGLVVVKVEVGAVGNMRANSQRRHFMEYRIVFRQTNKVGPGHTASVVEVDLKTDAAARRKAKQLLAMRNKKGRFNGQI